MVIEFSPEVERRLQEIAGETGLTPESYVAEALLLLRLQSEDDDRLVLEQRRNQADANLFIDEDDMDRSLQWMMRS